jgi:hypothetical protein
VGKAVVATKKGDTLSHISSIAELRVSCDVVLKSHLQMTDACFNVLPRLLKLYIGKQNTRIRRAISAEEKITATLRFLATGGNFEDLKCTAAISRQALV